MRTSIDRTIDRTIDCPAAQSTALSTTSRRVQTASRHPPTARTIDWPAAQSTALSTTSRRVQTASRHPLTSLDSSTNSYDYSINSYAALSTALQLNRQCAPLSTEQSIGLQLNRRLYLPLPDACKLHPDTRQLHWTAPRTAMMTLSTAMQLY